MKAKRISLLYMMLFFLAATSCDDGGPKRGTLDDLSPYVRQYLSMRNSSFISFSAESSNMMNRSYQMVIQNLTANGRVKEDTVKNDSTVNPNPWEWQYCATLTTIENTDGSKTEIRDYGDGCEEGYPGFYYLMRGKISTTSKYSLEETQSVNRYDYVYKTVYENYGGKYPSHDGDTTDWSMDGCNVCVGKAQYHLATKVFTGEFKSEGETIHRYDGPENVNKYSSHTVYTTDGWTTDVSEYEYRYGDNFYSAKLTKPLIFKYSCNQQDGDVANNVYVWIYVSGTEVIQYSQDGVAGSFIINYGNGRCDNVVSITENGVTVEIDLSGWRWFGGIATNVGG